MRDALAPVLRALHHSGAPHTAWFERVNKPAWGIRFHVLGDEAWLQSGARSLLDRGFGVAGGLATFTEEDPEDKWLGGLRERQRLQTFHHHDTSACVAALEAESRGALPSRAQHSLLLVEGFLDRLQLSGDARLDFYRRGFEWAVEMGRWDAAVFEALEATFAAQRDALTVAIDVGRRAPGAGAWGSGEAERIALTLLGAVREPFEALAADCAGDGPGGSLVDVALFATRAHSNRLGINASREATLRYLAWRTRGGGPVPAP